MIASGASIEQVIAVFNAEYALSVGDDDLPDSRIGGCNVSGPPSRKEIGCANGACLYEWTDTCGNEYYQITDANGDNGHFLEPYHCVGCRP